MLTNAQKWMPSFLTLSQLAPVYLYGDYLSHNLENGFDLSKTDLVWNLATCLVILNLISVLIVAN